MKRTTQILSLALALLMALTLLPMTAFAADDRYNSAQTITSSNGDGRTPFNLKWVDGAKGLISFDVQNPALTDTSGMVNLAYHVYVYRDETYVGEVSLPTKMSGSTAQVDISKYMSGNGKYEFLVCFYDIQDSKTIAKSAPYQVGSGTAAPSAPTTDFAYDTKSDGTLTITGYRGSSTNLVIPGEIDGKKVTEIGMRAFDHSDLISVTIPDSVTYIGQEAFWVSDELTTVNLGGGVECIGVSAFRSCYALNNVVIPDNVDEICSYAFMECTSLTSITIPATVVKRSNPGGTMDYTEQFDGCTALKVVHWKTAMKLPARIFNGCAALTELYIYENEAFVDNAFGLDENAKPIIPANLVVFADGFNAQVARNRGFTVKPLVGDTPTTPVTPPVTPPTPPAQPAGQTVNPTASTVYVNGTAKAFEAYNIGGNNFFKLRDLAMVLRGTAKQFEVGYDNATRAITLTTGKAYTAVGGELVPGDGKAKNAVSTPSKLYLNGTELSLTAYNINGNNFFKLRDLMKAIDVFVGYDNATRAITLDSSKGYVEEGAAAPSTPTPTPTTPTAPTDTATGATEFIILMSGDKATGLSGIRLIFKGDAPDIEMNQFTSPKLTKNGEAYRFSFLENIRKEILPQYKGDNSPYTMFSINFYTPITEPGIYTLEFNYKGISYKTGNVEIKG